MQEIYNKARNFSFSTNHSMFLLDWTEEEAEHDYNWLRVLKKEQLINKILSKNISLALTSNYKYIRKLAELYLKKKRNA